MRSYIIWIIAVIVVVAGGYGAYTYYMKNSQNNPQGPAATPQVQGQDVKVGDGAEAKPGDTVSVLYVGRLQDGTVFDSSQAHNNEPLKFTLGVQGIIPGFQIGVNGMKVGGERLLSIPPELGYGAQDVKDPSGKIIIPANSTIIFDVQLVKVEVGTSTPTTTPATP